MRIVIEDGGEGWFSGERRSQLVGYVVNDSAYSLPPMPYEYSLVAIDGKPVVHGDAAAHQLLVPLPESDMSYGDQVFLATFGEAPRAPEIPRADRVPGPKVIIRRLDEQS